MHTASNLKRLAPREAEALTYRSRGLSNKEASEAMQCSVANVINLLAECFYKLHPQ
ncbi:LuxR C-terminal-related transcriptional regulator [Microbulbifer sp. JMSA002]|uniref:LuxR C-terminal-related transcriptional regulator n=1 Tax=Microbulbifer sp. JMSA002 TaxID=3243368 RepID=UPI00403A71BC